MKDEVKSVIGISITVILILIIVYFTTAIFMTGEIGNKKVSKSTEEEYVPTVETFDNTIIASRVFSQNDSDYYVIITSKKDISESLKSSIKNYNSESKSKLYFVNTDEAINKYVVSKEDNMMPTNSSELKVKKTALIKINSGTVVSYITNEDEIMNILK